MHEQYQPEQIEAKIQQAWDDAQVFKATEDHNREKFYCLTMFPYPSGKLHMGHVRVYTITDVIARYQRMLGKNVMQPMGWDAFGLPAENAAIAHKVAPAKWTYENIEIMRDQFKSLGCGYDWSRELATCKPEYYKWEQWLFLQMYKKGLVYKKNSTVNWDPVDQTVLANEQVVDGRGWRSGALIEQREIPQWFIKITDYADELLDGLDSLDQWPDQVKTMQRNWIGRSEGCEVRFDVPAYDTHVDVFTTRADTLMGVTYLAVAAQHPLAQIAADNNASVAAFVKEIGHAKVSEAELNTQEKKGIDTGIKAIHPVTGEEVSIWIANFVLMNYGSGAVMSVPAHDQRDFEFATKYNLPIKQVIKPSLTVISEQDLKSVKVTSSEKNTKLHNALKQDNRSSDGMNSTKNIGSHHAELCDLSKAAFVEKGDLCNSGDFDGLSSQEATQKICEFLEENNQGKKTIQYRLRDWGVSRQRYWGAPIPMINCDECGVVPVPQEDLPVKLPEDVDFTGATSPLADMPEFLNVTCPKCGGDAKRETDTFDTFFESSWYYTRYTCKDLDKAILDDRVKYWTPVDQYVGGVEHAVMHLLYARFIHKVIRDEGFLANDEPFTKLLTQGMVLKDGAKMSKSKGNVVSPGDLIAKYGADTVRFFVMFAAPPEQSLEWSDSGVEGAHRFLKKVWAQAYLSKDIIKSEVFAISSGAAKLDWENATEDQCSIRRDIYTTLKQVSFDIERQQYNTVVSGCMKLFNVIQGISLDEVVETVGVNTIDPSILQQNNAGLLGHDQYNSHLIYLGFNILLKILAPIAPHIAQELWDTLDFEGLIINAPWPKVVQSALQSSTFSMIVQVNGKLRDKISVATDADNSSIESQALAAEKVQKFVEGKEVKKVIVVPQKLVNIVVAG